MLETVGIVTVIIMAPRRHIGGSMRAGPALSRPGQVPGALAWDRQMIISWCALIDLLTAADARAASGRRHAALSLGAVLGAWAARLL